MPEVVLVSSVEKADKLKRYLEESFKSALYPEITQAIGMHSLLIDSEHTMKDQSALYHDILHMIKEKIRGSKGKSYSEWYANFPKIMDELVSSKQVVTDKASIEVIASRRDSYGAFKSLDDFFFWALDDRRLNLKQIITYIERTAEMHGK
jgi:hypothetical protein